MPEERKLVTILFADIVGSTATGFEHDPEVVRAALARTFDAARAVLETHGGTVEKFIGDAVMAVFGVPMAHDDDADRAVRAAFVLRARAAEVAPAKLAFTLRIGVNTGDAVTGTGEGGQFLVTGPVVNVAARVQQAAAPGEILVGPLTHRVTRGGVEYGDPRQIDAKGAGSVVVHPALALRSVVPEQQRGVPGLRAPLIGRDRELALLHAALERCAGEGAPVLVTIYGTAGAGKSRLVSEFAAALPGDRVRAGRCLPYGEGVTFYPVQLLLRSETGIDLNDDLATAEAKLERAVAAAFAGAEEDAAAVRQRLRVVVGFAAANEAVPDVAESDLPEEIRWGVRRYLERRAQKSPLVLVFEDVHWAEAAMLDLIERLAESARAPLLLVCLARHELRESRPSFGANVPNSLAITLAPLPPDDTRRLIGELLAIDALPEDRRAEVIARAEGNPLYVEEFLRLLIETGRVEQRGAKWTALGDLTDLEVPPTLRGLITARLDSAAAPLKRLLQCASIVGRLFSTSALEAIGGEPPDPVLLREGIRNDLLAEADERAPGSGRVHRFKHVLFREVAYSTLPKSDRARMHGNYRRWLAATVGERKEEVAEILAYHAEQAFLYANELGWAEASELGAQALDLLIAAADRARRSGDAHAAMRLYERASSVAEATRADEAKRVHALGYALLARRDVTGGEVTGTDPDLERALGLAEAVGPSEVLVDLLGNRAVRAFNTGDRAASKAAFDRLPDVARATGLPELLVRALLLSGNGAQWLRDLEAERRRHEQAVEEARRGAPRRLPEALELLSRVVAIRDGAFSRAAELRAEAAAARPADLSQFQRAGWAWTASHFTYLIGDLDGAVAQGREAVARAREAGQPHELALAEWFAGQALLEAGEPAEARTLLEEGAAIMDRVKAKAQIPELHARAALACLALADLAAADAHIRFAKENLLEGDLGSYYITAIAGARLAAATGEPQRADAIAREALAKIEVERFDLALARLAYAEILLTQERFAEAKPLLVAAREFFLDPLAYRRRERIEALIAKCDAATRTSAKVSR
jgi:class 3 adenylate cyclase